MDIKYASVIKGDGILPNNITVLQTTNNKGKYMMKSSRNMFVTRVLNVAAIAILSITLFANHAANAADLYWMPTSGTDSWFTVSNWNTHDTGSGSSYLPTPADQVLLRGGVCSLDSGSNAVVDKVGNAAAWTGASSYTP